MKESHRSDIRILLIEDNPATQRFLLESIGTSFAVGTVDSLSEGLAQLAKDEVDVVLLELRLALGWQLDGFLSKLEGLPSQPVVIMLASVGDMRLAIEALSKGVHDYLVKDQIDSGLLERAIRYGIERKKVEDRLRKRESDMRNVMTHIADGIIVVDGKGTVLFVNPAALRLLGREEKELIGAPFGLPMIVGQSVQINMVSKEGGVIVAEMQAVAMEWQEQSAFLLSLHDVTELLELRDGQGLLDD